MFSAAGLADLKTRIDLSLASGRLDRRQTRFMLDIRRRLDRNARLSDSQVDRIEKLIGAGSREARVLGFRKPSRQRRGPGWLLTLLVIAIGVGGMILLGVAVGLPELLDRAPARQAATGAFSVVDGDTVRVAGESAGTRLVGFNAPETYRARCASERRLGQRATARLKQLVASGRTELVKVACACRPGTEGTRRCNYGRSCGVLRVDGRDVGAILIREGLAVPFVCGATRCPRTPRPWCG